MVFNFNYFTKTAVIGVEIMRTPKIKITNCKIYAVGGCVRDFVLGLPENDIDYLIVGAGEKDMDSLGLTKVGKDFPVYLDDEGYEYALARTEKKCGHGYNNFITTTDGVTLEEDLKRRDLTINSICYDFETSELLDPLNGIGDLKNKILRMSNSRSFIEDPVRIIRLARFNSRFSDFTIDPETRQTILNMDSKDLEFGSICAERINLEFEKMWKQCLDPSIYFRTLDDLGVLKLIAHEISDLKYIRENLEHHPEGNTFDHIMIALTKAKELNLDVDCMWMVLTHDFGKITTKDSTKHLKHEADGIPIVEGFCKRLRLTNSQTMLCKLFCEQHMRASKLKIMKSFKIADLFDKCKVDHTNVIIEKVMTCSIIDKIGRAKECEFPFTLEEVKSLVLAYKKRSGKDVIDIFTMWGNPIPQDESFKHELKILRGLEISKARRSS